MAAPQCAAVAVILGNTTIGRQLSAQDLHLVHVKGQADAQDSRSKPETAADTARLTLRVARPADAAAAATVPRALGLPPPSEVASEGSTDPGPCSRGGFMDQGGNV